MKKQYVGMGVLVLVMIAAGWYFVSLNEPKAAPVVTPAPVTTTPATTTEVATGTTSAPTTPDEIELDLKKLQGKDRLYTEEEGKYVNLSEEERKLVLLIMNTIQPNCLQEEYCAQSVASASLIALRDEYAILREPSPKPGQVLRLFDLRKTEVVETINTWYRPITSPEILFRIKLDAQGNEYLAYYRPGWPAFVDIPDSTLDKNLSYSLNGVVNETEYIVSDHKLTITVFRTDFEMNWDENGNIRPEARKAEKKFDLANLP
jgi:hypothetical protein